MGSIFYYDFILLHKFLNIRKMVSLEMDTPKARFTFNIPYDHIVFMPRKTTEYLDRFRLPGKSVVWFDYDSVLFDMESAEENSTIFSDLALICRKAQPLTYFLMSVDVRFSSDPSNWEAFLEQYRIYIPERYKAIDYLQSVGRFGKDFRRMNLAILCNYIEKLTQFQQVKFHKLFAFYYKDTAPMLTLGGVFADRGTATGIISRLRTRSKFIRTAKDQLVNIDIPVLTYREKLFLDSKIKKIAVGLSAGKGNLSAGTAVLPSLALRIGTRRQLLNYVDFCRYYPQYYEGVI